jgi:hypothetical protein
VSSQHQRPKSRPSENLELVGTEVEEEEEEERVHHSNGVESGVEVGAITQVTRAEYPGRCHLPCPPLIFLPTTILSWLARETRGEEMASFHYKKPCDP